MSDRIEAFMSDDSGEEAEVTNSEKGGNDRIQSLMNMEYDKVESASKEPEDNQVEKGHVIPKAFGEKAERKDPPAKEAKEESEEEEEESEEEEEKEEKEEKKEDGPKKQIVKYKIDGQDVEEELTEEEIAAAVSGRKAIQKRFTEVDQQRKQVAKESEEAASTVSYVKNEMMGIKEGFESAIAEFMKSGENKANPSESIYNLLDKMGLDASQFEKANFFHHLPKAAEFLDMNESEREAYLLGHENKWLKKQRNAVELSKKEAAGMKAKFQEENSLKRQAGVSEEEYEDIKGDLAERLGTEELNIEQVLAWKREKPALTRAEAIADKVKGTDAIKLARLFLEFPETTDEWILNELGYKAQQTREISSKMASKAPPKLARKSEEEESEEDMELFKQFRRR